MESAEQQSKYQHPNINTICTNILAELTNQNRHSQRNLANVLICLHYLFDPCLS
jgi:hypothetical protein